MVQRPLKGSRISSFYPVKTLPSLASLDSAFQLQEYISLLIRLDVHDVETIVSLPGRPLRERQPSDEDKENMKDGEKESKNEVVVDEHCWIYEQLRRLAQDLSHPLITMLQQECTRATCSEMKAAEWLYLCVAHGNDGAMEQCCAIDYILHTLDSATALLNSPRAFPSRLTIPEASRRHFPSLARRLGRIFAHAYFHHREAFEQAEAESSLYARFLALTSKFDLVPSEFLVIPPRLSSMHDNDENERLLDVREVEEPRRFLSGLDSQRGTTDRWGMSDTGSVIDLAIADDNEIIENQPDSAKKRWRSDTMVDRDTYLMGRKKREESLEKVFNEGVGQSQPEHYSPIDDAPPASELHILDIVAPAPTEPFIPISDISPEDSHESELALVAEKEELMKPPMVVPSQARLIPEPEPADPILEEPPITASSPIAASVSEEYIKVEPEDFVEQPVLEPITPADEEPEESAAATEADSVVTTDITTSAAEADALVPTSQSEDAVDTLLHSLEEAATGEIPEKEEDVTEAETEDVVQNIPATLEVTLPPPVEKIEPVIATISEPDDPPAVEEQRVVQEVEQERHVESVEDSSVTSEPATSEP